MSVPTLEELNHHIQDSVENELDAHVQDDHKLFRDEAERELDARVQDDHKLFHRNNPLPKWERDRTPSPSPVSDPQSESDDATMSETSSQAEFSAYHQEQRQRDKECDEEAWKEQQQQLKELREQDAEWASILHDVNYPPSSPPGVVATTLRGFFRQVRPHRNPPSSSDESSEDDFEVSDQSSDDDYAPSEDSERMYESDEDEEPTRQQFMQARREVSQLKMQLVLSQGSEECAKQNIRDFMNTAMMRDMVVEEQRELIEQQQKAAEQKDAEVSSLKQGFRQLEQQLKQQSAMMQALTSRQQATQQDVTHTANAIVSTQPTAQIEDLVTQMGSMSLGQGSQVSANVVFSAQSELDRRSSRVPEASSSLKNKGKDFMRSDSDTLKVPKVEYQARTKQTARATTSQAAPRRSSQISPLTGVVVHYATSSQAASRRSSEIPKMQHLVDLSQECINQALNRHAAAAVHFEQAKAASASASDDLTDFQYLTLVESAGASWCHLQDCVLKVKAELEEWLEYKVALAVLEEEVCPAAAREELTEKMEDALRIVDLPPRPNGHWRQEDGLWRFVTHQEMVSSDEDLRRWEEEDLCSECSTDCDSE